MQSLNKVVLTGQTTMAMVIHYRETKKVNLLLQSLSTAQIEQSIPLCLLVHRVVWQSQVAKLRTALFTYMHSKVRRGIYSHLQYTVVLQGWYTHHVVLSHGWCNAGLSLYRIS